jgi:hypothetical protein
MRALEHEQIAREDARRMSHVQLARLGIDVMNKYDLLLKCITCGETWAPQVNAHGKLSAGYWICPNKCNI